MELSRVLDIQFGFSGYGSFIHWVKGPADGGEFKFFGWSIVGFLWLSYRVIIENT
jgi:hypothetical protein